MILALPLVCAYVDNGEECGDESLMRMLVYCGQGLGRRNSIQPLIEGASLSRSLGLCLTVSSAVSPILLHKQNI
jgi:hypothetical protein